MKYVVKTQYMENYGWVEGKEAWKMKFGSDYLVHDVDSHTNAMAFVAEKLCLNQPGFSIEWPAEVIDYDLYDGDDFRPLKHVSADIAKVFS
jgi:hypothetical protein